MTKVVINLMTNINIVNIKYVDKSIVLGGVWGCFGCSLEDFGDLLGIFGVSVGVSWGPLGGSGSVLGTHLGPSAERRPLKFPKERRRCPPKVARRAQEAPRWPRKGGQEIFNEGLIAIKISEKEN